MTGGPWWITQSLSHSHQSHTLACPVENPLPTAPFKLRIEAPSSSPRVRGIRVVVPQKCLPSSSTSPSHPAKLRSPYSKSTFGGNDARGRHSTTHSCAYDQRQIASWAPYPALFGGTPAIDFASVRFIWARSLVLKIPQNHTYSTSNKQLFTLHSGGPQHRVQVKHLGESRTHFCANNNVTLQIPYFA